MTDGSKKIDAQQREHSDPYEGSHPVPKFVFALITLTFCWAIYYIASSNLSNQPELGDHRTMADLAPQAGSKSGVVDGAQIFAAQCVACHQAGGTGLPGVFPPLAGSEWVMGKESTLVQILLHGISGSLTVKGTVYKGEMPVFKDKLNDAEIAAVLTYVRSSFGNAAGKVDAALVKTGREASKDRKLPWSGDDELGKLK
ncbi:cytochrome c [Herminiimonas sp. CN]|uniref:c-type cytochrome n=1 Tax=Herminiimonas sp. CN TaxID=1349818 RepID=UPI00047382BB|nr:cytochrome c [Herminiimonas sp. CN]